MTELSQHPLPSGPASEAVRHAAQAGLTALQAVVVGKDAQVRRAFAAMLAGGHVLLEDLPGVGKTTLAKGLSRILGGTFQRVQGPTTCCPRTSWASTSGMPRPRPSASSPVPFSAMCSCSMS